ncbi:MAG: hypothetical protein MRY83_24960, partial [Flavobacteriales bacterium]|nr:hypothetical protein [Flavobacteriales bacterium]
TDTTLELMVRYIPEDTDRPHYNDNRIVMHAVNGDVTKPQIFSIFFEPIESIHENEIMEDQSPLTAWLNIGNLLTTGGNVVVSGGLRGHILFTDQRRLSYMYNNGRIIGQLSDQIPLLTQYYRFSSFAVIWKEKKYTISAGDVGAVSNLIGGGFGRGLAGSYLLNNGELSGSITRNIFNPIWYFGLGYHTIYRKIGVRASANYEIDNVRDVNSAGLNLGINTRVNAHSIGFGILPTIADFKIFTISGIGTRLNYSYTKPKKFRVNFNNIYNSDDFANGIGLQFQTTANIFYRLLDKHNFNLIYSNQLLEPIFYDLNKVKNRLGTRNWHIASLLYGKDMKQRIKLSMGPSYQYYLGDNNTTLQPEVISRNYSYFVGLTKAGRKQGHSLSGSISMGLADITQFDLNGNRIDFDPYVNTTFRLSARIDRGGLLFSYFIGAPSFTSIQIYRGNGANNRSLRINPYYKFSLLENRLQINTNLAWWYQMADNSMRTSFFAFMTYDMRRGWSTNANISYYGYNRTNEELGRQSFRDINMTVGVRKTFDFKQPRAKYYDLRLVFFKDKNGNRTKDSNEVGISDILVGLELQVDTLRQTDRSQYAHGSASLITNEFGEIQCIRALEGTYHVNTNPLKEPGEYVSLLGDEFDVDLDKNLTVYVPFIKSNKLYGQLIIKRDPYSSLGHISPSNIAVTATDSLGNVYKALTDKSGRFLIFAPQAGRYVVRLNNVYASNFSLRQKEFVVDFNGLKEFKVTFMLEEKKRKINFKGDINGFNFGEYEFDTGNDEEDNDNEGDGASDGGGAGLNDTDTDGADQGSIDDRLNDLPIIEEKEFDQIPRPIRPEDIAFTVQVGAFKTKDHPEIAEILKLDDVQLSKTPEGLTRYTVGSFSDFESAKSERDRIAKLGIQKSEFVLVIAKYKDHILTADEAKAILDEEHGSFSKLEDITLPLNKNFIKFRVQLGAYDMSKDHPEVNEIRKLNDLTEMKTPEGLTRFVIGEYGTIEEAKAVRKQLVEKNIVPDPNFVIIIGQYKAHVITADEALLLLEK